MVYKHSIFLHLETLMWLWLDRLKPEGKSLVGGDFASLRNRLSKCVVLYQYDRTKVSCKWHNNHDKQNTQKAWTYKQIGSIGEST